MGDSPTPVAVPAPKPVALAAPGLIGPVSILNEPVSGPRASRRSRNRPYNHAHLEIDIAPGDVRQGDAPHLQQVEQALSHDQLAETSDLVILTAGVLHAFSARRFRQIDHWEVSPGGWLPLPAAKSRRGSEEPVGEFLKTLEAGSSSPVSKARTFSARLSDGQGHCIDVAVRRAQRGHAISLDLRGVWTRDTIRELVGSIAQRVPVSLSTLTKFQYA